MRQPGLTIGIEVERPFLQHQAQPHGVWKVERLKGAVPFIPEGKAGSEGSMSYRQGGTPTCCGDAQQESPPAKCLA
jgi:hypothetical protein